MKMNAHILFTNLSGKSLVQRHQLRLLLIINNGN